MHVSLGAHEREKTHAYRDDVEMGEQHTVNNTRPAGGYVARMKYMKNVARHKPLVSDIQT